MKKDDLITQVQAAGQDESRLSLLFRHHLAVKAQLPSTDLECLEMIITNNRMTPGILSRETGLSTGAMTAALDRLERHNFIKRVRSTEDRRKVFVEPILQNAQEIFDLYKPFVTEATHLLRSYSIDELEIIRKHYRAMAVIYETQMKSDE
jgi:DNA-binding MarR family transcriptional regulator